jgi:two-component system chemotaxis sensor kinase CheA
MDSILEQFLSEARDNLDYLDSHLKELEGGDEETINSLFRAAHTLKGGAGLVGLTHIKEITHAAEDLLDAYRNGKIEFCEEMLDVLYDAFDEVIELIDATEESGDIELDFDKERIEDIKNNIRSFLSNSTENEDGNSIELPFLLADNIPLDTLTNTQLQRVLPLVKDYTTIDKTFIENQNYWIIDLNLSEDTIELGNDPFYLISLLENENIVAISTEIYNPEDLSNPLSLKTRLKVICKSDAATIEDIFYNIIDEISACALNFKSLLATERESIENDTFNTLLNEIKEELSPNELIQKLKAALNVINPETKEGFLVNRILDLIKIDTDITDKIFKELDIKSSHPKKSENDKNNEDGLSEKERETTLNILNSQLLALKTKGAFERVRFVLKSVASFLGVKKSDIDAIESEEELKEFVEKMIINLGGKTQEEIKSDKKSEKIEPIPKDSKKENKITTPKASKQHTSVPKTVKIDQEEIDSLMDIVGEILVIKNSLPYVADDIPKNPLSSKRELLSKYEEISRITNQLQDRVMGMRLLPISYIFNRYPKLVRDMSKKLDKKIEYKEYGSETKLDKMMIEKLADPLVHIIRNSLDHGLENTDERVKIGKNETGILTIGAKSEGDRVFVEISDDGRGIDLEKVINKALEKRLIEPDKLDNMSESEKLGLIFLPGLSTKDEITDLSGRGVGTDAVKTTVTELGGKIDIKSKKGEGTTIILELPVSVALTNLFQIKMANENYAIAMESVIETDKITKDEIQTANHKPFIKLRESIIPLVLDKKLLKRDSFKDEESIIIIKVADTQIALVADELVGQIDVVQKPLPGILKEHPYINGTSLLGNGKPLFVIKPEALFEVI